MSKRNRKAEAAKKEEAARGPIGWTPEITSRLKWAYTQADDFKALAMDVDREVGHFVAGIVALSLGEYELAALNLWNAGQLEKAPSAVEESE